jgi:hypothetical protein
MPETPPCWYLDAKQPSHESNHDRIRDPNRSQPGLLRRRILPLQERETTNSQDKKSQTGSDASTGRTKTRTSAMIGQTKTMAALTLLAATYVFLTITTTPKQTTNERRTDAQEHRQRNHPGQTKCQAHRFGDSQSNQHEHAHSAGNNAWPERQHAQLPQGFGAFWSRICSGDATANNTTQRQSQGHDHQPQAATLSQTRK